MDDFKSFEAKAWEAKASRYDNTWGKVSTQVNATILDLIKPLEGKKVLDLGCGPGVLCSELKNRSAIVTGADYSNNMLEIAKANNPNISFVKEDAEDLSFKDKEFCYTILNFLLLHVSNQAKTILEAKRVSSKGIVFSMWLPPNLSKGLNLMFSAVKKYADLSVIPPAEDIFTFASADYCKSFLIDNGFKDVTTKVVESFWKVQSAEEFFKAVQAGTRIGGTIDLQSSEVKDKIKADISLNIEQFKVDNAYIIPTPSLVVLGNI